MDGPLQISQKKTRPNVWRLYRHQRPPMSTASTVSAPHYDKQSGPIAPSLILKEIEPPTARPRAGARAELLHMARINDDDPVKIHTGACVLTTVRRLAVTSVFMCACEV